MLENTIKCAEKIQEAREKYFKDGIELNDLSTEEKGVLNNPMLHLADALSKDISMSYLEKLASYITIMSDSMNIEQVFTEEEV